MRTRSHLVGGGWWVLAALLAALLGCDGSGAPGGSSATRGPTTRPGGGPSPSAPPSIVASIYPLGQIMDDLVGDWAKVSTLLPPGASEHGFELTPTQVMLLSDADVLVTVGLGLDVAVEQASQRVARRPTKVLRFATLVGAPASAATQPATTPATAAAINADDTHDHDHAGHAHHDHAIDKPKAPSAETHDAHAHSEIHDHDHAHCDHDHHNCHAGPNPHLWLDPVLTVGFIKEITEQLAPMFPDHADSLRTRARLLRANLLNLHQQYEMKLGRAPQKKLVTFHNAFDLMAQRYGMQVVGHVIDVELSPGGTPPPERIRQITDLVRQHQLRVIYAEPQLPDAAARAIADAAGVQVMRLDPLGHPNLPEVATYTELMRKNLQTLFEGQSITP